MAVLAVALAGGAASSALGFGFSAGWIIGSVVGGYAFAENQTTEGPRVNDLKITGTDYGDTIPWVAGSPRIAGQIVWASNRRETRHEEEVGGKGGGGGATQVTYTYDCDLLIMLSENPCAGIARVWSNNELVFGAGRTKDGVWRAMRVHTGAADQLPDPVYEAAVGVGNAPAFRGRTTVLIEGLQLGGGGNIPNLTFEIGQATPGPVESDFFFADFTQQTTDDFACLSSVSQFGTQGAASWRLLSSGLELTLRGWMFEDIPAFGVYYKWYAGLGAIAAGKAIDLDIAFVANTYPSTDPRHVGSANVFTLAGHHEGVVSSNLVLLGAVDFASDGGVQKVSVNVWGAGVVDHAFITPHHGSIRVSVRMLAGIATVYINGALAGNKSIFYDLPTAHTLLLGGQVSASNKSNVQHAIVRYAQARVLIGAPAPLQPLVRPSCGALIYDGNAHPQPLGDVVDALLLRAECGGDEYDLSGFSELQNRPVRALALSQIASTRSALEVLQKCWHFECAASNKLYLRPRATTPVVRFPFADLGFSEQAGGLDDPLAIRMGNDLEMPAQIALTYPNVAGDYNADTQFSDRIITGQQSTQTMQVPVGMLPAEAKGVVDALLMDSVASLQSTTLSVPLKYAFVEPGDVVEAVAQDGRIYRLRVQTRKDQGIWLELECRLDDVGALDSAAITDEGYITVQDPASVPDTILHALDVPLLRDADDQPGFYLAVAPDSINVATDQWKGANVAGSWDDVDYASLLSILEAATVGEALTVLPAWSGGPVFDEASVLEVEMLGQLSSTSRSAMLLDEAVNALLVGDEIVRFRNAELVDADEDRGRYTYQLTGFIRGFRGTEWAMGGHVAGERCVLLNRSVRRVNTQLNELQVQRWLKATTVGKYITDVLPQAFTSTGRALRPFAPVGLRALTEEGLGVHLSWQRRTRLSYRYGGVSPSVPLGEATERYRVQVWQADALLRTEIVTQPSYEYTTTLAATDGLNAGDPVRFEVCQLSESVGAGYITTKEGLAA